MKTYRKRRMATRPRLFARRLLRLWPFVVWVAAIAAVVYLHRTGARFGTMTGIVETRSEPVAPLTTSRLISIDVALGARVERGDIVARMDTRILDAALLLEEARMLEAEGTIAGYQQNILQLIQRFEDSIRATEAALEADRLQEARDRAELSELAREHKRRARLFEAKLINEKEANELRPQIASLAKAVSGYPSLIASHERRIREARERRRELDRWLRIEEDQDVGLAIQKKLEARAEILASSKRLRELQKESYQLRTTQGGVVSRIYEAPGNVVAAGDPVLRIVSEVADRVIGFLPEIHLHDVAVGDVYDVFGRTGGGRPCRATVGSIAPEVQTLPGRVSPIRNQPLRGRRVVLDLHDGHSLIPGETVQIRPVRRWWPWSSGGTTP